MSTNLIFMQYGAIRSIGHRQPRLVVEKNSDGGYKWSSHAGTGAQGELPDGYELRRNAIYSTAIELARRSAACRR